MIEAAPFILSFFLGSFSITYKIRKQIRNTAFNFEIQISYKLIEEALETVCNTKSSNEGPDESTQGMRRLAKAFIARHTQSMVEVKCSDFG